MDAGAQLTRATTGRDVRTSWPVVDDVLAPLRGTIGADFDGYRNHVLRVLNFCDALAGDGVPDALVVAAAFHDIGIWTHHTFDYLGPSSTDARAYQCAHHHSRHDVDAVERAILQHHRVRPIRDDPDSEVFRRADWIDVSLGALRFGLPADFVAEVRRALPDRGFHARLVKLAARQCLRTPLRPLPMLRW